MENTTTTTSPRLPGTTYIPTRRRWWARIWYDRRRHHLGYFKTSEKAHAAYLKAKAARSKEQLREAFDRLDEVWRAVVRCSLEA